MFDWSELSKKIRDLLQIITSLEFEYIQCLSDSMKLCFFLEAVSSAILLLFRFHRVYDEDMVLLQLLQGIDDVTCHSEVG